MSRSLVRGVVAIPDATGFAVLVEGAAITITRLNSEVPPTMWSSGVSGEPVVNPLLSDSKGTFSVWLDANESVVVTATISDNGSNAVRAGTDTQIAFDQYTTSLHGSDKELLEDFSNLCWVDVETDGGALGDGVTNDIAALNASAVEAETRTGRVSGDRTKAFAVEDTWVIGGGVEASGLTLVGGPSFDVVAAEGTVGNHQARTTLRDLNVDQQATVQGLTFGILGRYHDDLTVSDVFIKDHSLEGIEFQWAGARIRYMNVTSVDGHGDAAHFGDCDAEGSIHDYVLHAAFLVNPADDTVGHTAGPQRGIVSDSFGVGTGFGAGMDHSGDSYVLSHHNFLAAIGQHGSRAQKFGFDTYWVVSDGEFFSDWGTGQAGWTVFNANKDHPDFPIRILGATYDAMADALSCMYTAGSFAEFLDFYAYCNGKPGIILDGTGLAPGIRTVIGGHFNDADIAIKTGGNPNVGEVIVLPGTTFTNCGAPTDDYDLVRVPLEPTDLTLAGAWVNTVGFGFLDAHHSRNWEQWVELGGAITGGADGSTIDTLNPGFRPAGVRRFSVASTAGLAQIGVYPTGEIVAEDVGLAADITFLDGIRFKAA